MNPYIAITLGDPAGIGPEVVLNAVTAKEVREKANCVVVGNKDIINMAIDIAKMPMKVNVINNPKEGIYEEGVLNLINLENIDIPKFKKMEINGMCGRAAYEYIEKSVKLAMERKVDAVATAPINKESLKAGGVDFIGHTEIFGALTNTKDPLTMFEVKGLRVFFLTRHVSLKQACDMIKKDRIKDYIRRCTEVLRRLGIADGTMAIAGLNPHCGEHGLFGDEEVREVFPAIEEIKSEGYKVEGPIGADSVFHLALQGKYNSVLSLYHDQGHIATKTYDFYRTIAITGGMPILRTSVDHGTAMDIAWQGKASAVSMKEAILLAAKYSPAFKQ